MTTITDREIVKHQFLPFFFERLPVPALANLVSPLTEGYQTPTSYTNLIQVCCGMILGSAKLAGYETNHTL